MSAYPAESFAQLFENIVGCGKDSSFPAFLHECLIHRTYRWELPKCKSIPDHIGSPTGEGRVAWVVQLNHWR
eukprot:2901273-Pyramimonas_sp.AAC.1